MSDPHTIVDVLLDVEVNGLALQGENKMEGKRIELGLL